MNVKAAREALHHLLALPRVTREARYYAKLAISHLDPVEPLQSDYAPRVHEQDQARDARP